jgi:osmotically-inducible protein OsmY
MSDKELHDRVREAIERDPGIDAMDIVVTVRDGIVILQGDVKSYRQRAAAERLAFGVEGVRAVANDVNAYSSGRRPSDPDIAAAALSALRQVVPGEEIMLSVTDGWITLNGLVSADRARLAAGNALRNLSGVRGVSNSLCLLARAS